MRVSATFLDLSTASLVGLAVQQAQASYVTTILADNPAVYFQLHETTGTLATNSGTLADGTYTGSCTLGTPGPTDVPRFAPG